MELALSTLKDHLEEYCRLRKVLRYRIDEINDAYQTNLLRLKEEISEKENTYQLQLEEVYSARAAISIYGIVILVITLFTGALSSLYPAALVAFAICSFLSLCFPLFYSLNLIKALQLAASGKIAIDSLEKEIERLKKSLPD